MNTTESPTDDIIAWSVVIAIMIYAGWMIGCPDLIK